MITFTKIKWKNLLSTGNVFTEIILNKNKNTIILGSNGSGKSTILDALTFGLFGKAFRNINKPQLLNTINNKDLVVELYFNIGTNKYKIIRGIKPNVFEVYMNDKLLNQSAESKDYQEILEKQILKVNYKSFCQVVLLGSATFQPFMQLSKGQRREVIEDLLDLQIFTSMNAILKDKISVNNNNIQLCTNTQKLAEQKIQLIKDHKKQLETNNEQIIIEKTNLIKTINEDISKIRVDIDILMKNIQDLTNKLKTENNIKKKLKELEILKHKIDINISTIENDIEFFNKHDDCPTCKQTIDEQFKLKYIKEKNNDEKTIKDGLVKLNKEIEKTNKKINEFNSIREEISNLKLEQYNLNNKVSYLSDKIKQYEKDILLLTNNNNNTNDDKILELEKELEETKVNYNELMQNKNIYSSASILLKDNGIKAIIIKQYVPIINKLINKYLSALDFFVQFELNEEFEENIKSRYRDDFTYSSFSEGEKMKINLAILFTWRAVAKLRNSINTNLLIMDEIFDSSLDLNGTEEFMKLLNDLNDDTNTFIISHKKDQLLDKFENVITFEKKKNFSKITKGV